MHQTVFTSVNYYNKKNYSLFFGDYKQKEKLRYEAGVCQINNYYFDEGDIFAIDLWERGKYGTSSWNFYILKCSSPNIKQNLVKNVQPSAIILLSAKTPHYAKKIISILNNLKREGKDLSSLSEDSFRRLGITLRERKPK